MTALIDFYGTVKNVTNSQECADHGIGLAEFQANALLVYSTVKEFYHLSSLRERSGSPSVSH